MIARLLCLAFLLFAGAPAWAADLIVDAASDFIIEARINGLPVRLRVDPETSGYIILNPEAVARLGLRRSWIGSETRIGPVRLRGSSKVASVTIGAVTGNRRIVWIDRPMAQNEDAPVGPAVEGADGLIGPVDLPYDRIGFAIGPIRAGEATTELAMGFSRQAGLFYDLAVGADIVHLQFSLIKPDSMATAAAAALIGSAYGGSWIGDARDQPIEFGISRPVRPMTLARPVDVGGFRFAPFLVRTGDNRGNLELPPEPDADPDELVVTAGSRQRAMFALTLGLDRLRQCSSMVWDNRTRRLTLHCTDLIANRQSS